MPAKLEHFIKSNTRLLAPPLVPELKLHLAEESLPIWQKSEEELQQINVPPPYWAFAWAGGQALSRHLLDHRSLCAGKAIFDLGSGSGVTAIAAAMAGARSVVAVDIDPYAAAACRLNAEVNGIAIETRTDDVLDAPPPGADVFLIGDLFYERGLADRVNGFIAAAKSQGALVLIGDPERSYFPRGQFTKLADYHVPVTRELEDSEIKKTAVWSA